MNVSTKQWLLDLIDRERDRALKRAEMRDGEIRYAVFRRIDDAVKLVKRGPEEPRP